MADKKRERVPDYPEMVKYLTDTFPEVDGKELYEDLFPDNEKAGEHKKNHNYEKPNAVYLYSTPDGKMHRRIMLKDTWSKDYDTFVKGNPMTLCSGLTFRGRTNQMAHAQRMHALIIDLDSVGLEEIKNFFHRCDHIEPGEFGSFPHPTYIVASGGGVHIYYVFKEPIDLYPNIKLQAKQLKYNLIYKIWDYKMTTREKDTQYQGIAQGYRMPGSVNSKYGTVIRAFRTGPRVEIEYLNKYVDEKNRVDLLKPFRPTQKSLEQAKHDYPEWYQRRIVDKQKPDHWHIKKDLYNWWIRQVGRVIGGHRYFYCMILAIYASKCDVPFDTLREDMIKLLPQIQEIKHKGDPFTMQDVNSALEAYDKGYFCFTIDDIEHLMNIRIDKNRRNGRPQNIHLMGARALQDIKHKVEGTNWRQGNGRKRKCEVVYTYRQEHPEENVSQVARALKISRHTVYRWWNYIPEPEPGQE